MSESSDLLNGADAAKYLGVSTQRIYQLSQEGKIGRVLGGYWLYTKRELDEYRINRKPVGRPKAEKGK